ncbi:hypothetical protein LEP1GSC193_4274 [Leptospira alstonii serovar Pingchang str. 80-412]|uniref:Uncharacterized protein n=2 Tax=Leptospira alstonii TaxID=28452 RepID=M6DDG5_9LEPT|nr:hypothetical protein LEP1GSC194_0258 [Leptospira alstonii serovar Sichuan str. 79601]EQA80268.1 hypothetical protein LEP1GSC193_4274 [Leptospira alstonii serovar Pingchang str. 80-412]
MISNFYILLSVFKISTFCVTAYLSRRKLIFDNAAFKQFEVRVLKFFSKFIF